MQNADITMFYDFCVVLFEQQKLITQSETKDIHNTLKTFIKMHFDHDLRYQYTRDILYIMAALADEIFLNETWEGKSFWEAHILEYEFFKTQIAGDVIFDRIEELLKNQNAPVALCKIYLEILAFGFRGKYRGIPSETTDIDALKNRIYAFVEKSEKTKYKANHRLFQEQYDCTLPTIARKLLPDADQLLYVCLGFIFLFIVLSSIAWLLELKEFNELLEEISVLALRK